MFKDTSFADEICAEMHKSLIANQNEERFGFAKLAQAIDLLSTSAEMLDQIGKTELSDELMTLISSIK